MSGRTHQIRVHISHLGYPLVSDARYNATKRARRQEGWCPRLFLHAERLQLTSLEGVDVDVRVPLAHDLAQVLSLMEETTAAPGHGEATPTTEGS